MAQVCCHDDRFGKARRGAEADGLSPGARTQRGSVAFEAGNELVAPGGSARTPS